VALELTDDLPDSVEMIDKWTSEPVRALIINTSVFDTNERGFPVLSGKHQYVVKAMFLQKV
jgi:protein arginine N-methyltransferase 5